ncbi:GPO family capsid scaffolding protein [Kosakonia sacchari]|uniref:GPO family capsid scaffolding protein n=1 Tax=Kosakonia sacchari TaxID=1158459 RepID=A0ABZ0MKX8_9ENTR|nr:GPO family capsid scaffolding protein [Kosakonia sacchari]WOZ76055.1 GPO family capsid scaffolding protein [Kosakonia sacchari]
MSHLLTDWLCIATEGDTVDGREVYRDWIIDMGETYNFDHYGARLWPEHERDYGTFGEVREAMWKNGDDGLARLYAKISPSMSLIYANQADQMVYFSIEPEENWRGSGRTYLKGLAVTDRPASVGTTRLRFSERKKIKPGYYAFSVTCEENNIKVKTMKPEWQKLFGIKPKFEEQPAEDNPGGDDKLQALANAVNDLEARVGAIEEKLNATVEDVETIAEVVDTQEFSTLLGNIKNVVKNFSKLDEKVTERPQRQFGDKDNKRFKFL